MNHSKLIRRFVRMFGCDTARITSPCGKHFLILGFNRNTKKEREAGRGSGQWTRIDGIPFDFDYVEEQCVASGKTESELIASAKHYKRLQGMTWEEFFESGEALTA